MKLKIVAASILLLSAPLTLRAASVRLAWNPSSGRSVVGYKVHYGLKHGKYTQMVQVKGRLTTKTVIKGLNEGKTYFFAVSAYNKKGQESPLSSEISGKPGGKTANNHNQTPAVPPLESSPPKIPPRTLQMGPGGKILPTR